MDNNTKKKIGLNLKAKLLSNALLPVIILFAGLVVAVSFLIKSSLEEETLRGLLASAYSYREAGLVYIDRAEGDNDMENLLKESSSYDYTWFDGSKRKNSSLGESVIGTEATAAVIEEVIQNRKVYTSTKTDVAGEDFFVAYVPVIDSQGKAIGMAFTGVSRESIEAEIIRSIIIMVVIATVIVLVVICTILPSSISMSGAIKEIAEIVNKLEKGIFEESNKYLNRKDEIGDTLRSANSLVGRYKEFATDIKEASGVISSEASELANTSNDISVISNEVTGSAMQISGGADEQVKVIVEVTENITVLSKGIQEVSDYSGELRVTANEMNEAGRYSAEALKKLSKNIAVVENDVTTIAETMADTNQAVLEVSEITDSITNIASQTNLLALNASIEAARAGDAGKGFAVVADEMGMLATSVAQLTKSISSKMSNLLAQAKDSIEKTDRISVNCKNVTEVLKDTDAQITNLLENVEETTHKVNHISARAEECDKSKDVIVDAMTSLTAISQENLALTESTAGSMEEIASRVNLLAEASNKLNEVTEELSNDVGFFKI